MLHSAQDSDSARTSAAIPAAIPAAIIASLPDAILSIDRRSTIVYANPAALRLFGFPAEEFLGRSLTETIVPPDLRGQHLRGMERFAAKGSGPVIGRRIDITACDRAGRRFPIELLVFLDQERPGEIFHAAIRDASDRAARDAVMTAERERLREMLDATADAWWDCALDGQTRYSDSAATVLGFADAGVPSCDPPHLPSIHADDRARVLDAWEAHLAGRTGRYECTHRVTRADGAVRWLRQRGRAVEFSLGRPTRIVGTIADVSEQQAAEERLRNAQKLELLGLLAGGFAHDLNNLLAAIRGHAALASTEQGVSAPALESLASIQLATTRARMLTSNLLSLGKPSVESIERFTLRSAIEEAIDLIRPGVPRSIDIVLDLAQIDDLEVTLDPTALQQALINLLLNARDAMPGGGRLRVGAAPLQHAGIGDAVRLTVEDTGVGIAPEFLGRVFEPFFTTKGQGVGTGLGLPVVHQVVTGAGGLLSIESDVGRGTRFTIVLPARRRAAQSSPSPTSIAGRSSRTVLLAESHPVLRPMLAEALRASGFHVLEADGATRALELARMGAATDDTHRVAALVAESGSEMNAGASLHARLESQLGRSLPAVLMSAHAGVMPASGTTERVRVLQKPFEITELVEVLEAVLAANDPDASAC